MIRFFRAHGLGNDYLVIDLSKSTITLTSECVYLLCHRNLGLGGDGLLLQVPSERARFGVRIFNPDGSEAEKSGNGLRIFTRYLHDTGQLPTRGSIETAGGIVHAEVHPRPDAPPEISVEMGRPTFAAADIPLNLPEPDAIDREITLPAHRFRGTAVSVGNPHWVMFVQAPDEVPLQTVGPQLEHHSWFPNRTNVQFAQVLDRNRVRVRIWERGAGETLASGSSACAVVAAGVRTGRLGREVVVEMPGGALKVRLDEAGVLHQRGPVTVIATGEVSAELEAHLATLSRG